MLWHIQQVGRSKGKAGGGQNRWIERAVVKVLDNNEGLTRSFVEAQKAAKEQGEGLEFPLTGMWESSCKWHGHTVAGMEYECPAEKRNGDLDKEIEGK